jgi:uncharacterized protein (DUF58 family)
MALKTHAELTDPEVLARLSRLDVRARGLVEGSFSGMHKSPHRGSSVEFAQYREYVPGDDINNLDWKVYARTDRFYIKEFEADTNLRCHLVIDTSGSMGFAAKHGSKLDVAKKYAATLAHLLVRQGDAVGLQCFDEKLHHDVPARGGPKHLGTILTLLSSLQPKGETRIVQTLHDLAEKIRRRAMIVVFSDFFTDAEELLDCFQHMRYRKHDLAIFQMLDDDELTFEFDRSIRFVDLETKFSIVSEPSVIRNEYLDAINAHMERLKLGCREFHVDYRPAPTSKPYGDLLSEFLLERQRRS